MDVYGIFLDTVVVRIVHFQFCFVIFVTSMVGIWGV